MYEKYQRECVSVDQRVGEHVCQIRVKVTLNVEYK